MWRASDPEPNFYIRSEYSVAFRGDRFLTDKELTEELGNALESLSGKKARANLEEQFWYAEAPESRIALYFKGTDVSVIVRNKAGKWREFSIQKLRGRSDSRINIDGLKYEPGLFFSAAYDRWVIRWVDFKKGWRSAWFSPNGEESGTMGGYLLGWIDGYPLVRLPEGVSWKGKSYLSGSIYVWRIEERAGFQVGPRVIFTGPNETMFVAESDGASLRISELGPSSFIPFTYSILPHLPIDPQQEATE